MSESRVATPADTSDAELSALLDKAIEAAPVLAASSPLERAGWLDAAADALDSRADDLVPLAHDESHLTVARLTGELTRTTFQLRLFAGVLRDGAYLQATIDHADATWGMGPRPDLRRVLRPLGPVAIWAASNFPFAFSVAGGDTASALAAGAPVLLKAHPGHPRLSVLTGSILSDALTGAGAPEGIFSLVTGVEIGRTLIVDPRVTAGAFTGSLGGGRALFDLASSRPVPIPFFGELGSVNPTVITRAAAAARTADIAQGFVASMSLGVGQFCTKPGVLLVPAGSGVREAVAGLVGDVAPAEMLNAGLSAGYRRAVAGLASHAGVDVVAGEAVPAEDPAPTVFATTVAELLRDPEGLTEERFGPAALVVEYESDSDLLAAVDVFGGQLTTTVHGDETEGVVGELLAKLTERSGRVLWNDWPTGVSVTYAQQHGGPYPATTAVQTTSVGAAAIERFLRPVSYQGVPQALLPASLRDDNPWGVPQRIDGELRLP